MSKILSTLIVALAALGLGACADPVTQNPPSVEQPEVPPITTTPDEFIPIDSTWTQTQVNAMGHAVLSRMGRDCNLIKNQYKEWEQILIRSGSSSGLVANQINFAQNTQAVESNIANAYAGRNTAFVRSNVIGHMSNLETEVRAMTGGVSGDDTKRNLCRAQIQALWAASFLSTLGDASPSIYQIQWTEFTEWIGRIPGLGGTPIPQNDLNVAITTLKNNLSTTIGNDMGPGKYDIIKQFEDFGKFLGFDSARQALGFEPYLGATPPRSIAQEDAETTTGM